MNGVKLLLKKDQVKNALNISEEDYNFLNEIQFYVLKR